MQKVTLSHDFCHLPKAQNHIMINLLKQQTAEAT